MPSAAEQPDPLGAALVEEASRRAGLVWLTVAPGSRARAAWHVWSGGAAYVVTGGLEQPLPELLDGATVRVTVPSKDKGCRLVTWVARAAELPPGSAEWDAAVRELHGARLNARDGEQQPRRWAQESRVLRLEPTGEVTEQPGEMPGGDQASPPLPSRATTRGRLPGHATRRRRRPL